MNWLRTIKRVWQALPLSDHWRWRITAFLLEPILPFIRGSVVQTAYLKEKEWHSKRIQPFHGDAFPPLPASDEPDVIFFGVIDWRYRIQRPQHLALGLASLGYRVFYVSTAFVNDGKAGFELEQMDRSGRLFNVRLHIKGRPRIYTGPPSQNDLSRLKSSIAALLDWTGSKTTVSIVQHPYWTNLVASLPDNLLIYDCIDHHGGFDNTGENMGSLEQQLLSCADAVTVTSQWLHDFAAQHNPNVFIVRNAVEFDLFSRRPAQVFADPKGRRIIGYFGAIAGWMDIDLLRAVAEAFQDCLLLLVGADEAGARQKLGELPNVMLTGEVDYLDLPSYLHGMDICLLPFKVIPLTIATNPVKVYEYLAAGKPVVATDLPEMSQFGGLVETANTPEGFIHKISLLLDARNDAPTIEMSHRFAADNTWPARVKALLTAIDSVPPHKVSIIVLTHNNLDLTRACLNSVYRYTAADQYEIIVVDNASSDGTQAFLKQWADEGADRIIILNESNLGFAAGNNQGMSAARGDYLVLLNNDTEVTQGWLPTLVNHLRRTPSLGIVGPVTDNIGNEAKITLRFKNEEEMHRKAHVHTRKHMGELRPMRTLAFFCVAFPRHVYERVGPLDEDYGLGFFEDDDYCRRIEQAGWNIACAEDVFVHHHLSASFGKLGKQRQALMERNRKIYEAKWGTWTPHRYR